MVGMYCIIRGNKAGVFAGVVEEIVTEAGIVKVTASSARRIWHWEGACSLSQLAMEGTKDPKNCNFSVEVDEMIIIDVIEIIPCTEEARKNIKGVYIWKK